LSVAAADIWQYVGLPLLEQRKAELAALQESI
jgi:hypothetical protein